MTSSAPQPAHWSKDFVEHLRTVHFTLIALCIGLVILALFPSETEIQRAHDQAAEILRVTNGWDSSLIVSEIKRLQTELIKANNKDDFSITNETISPNFAIAISSPPAKPARLLTPDISLARDWTLNLDFPSELHEQRTYPYNPFKDYQAVVHPPPNLKLFALLWDDLRDEGQVTFPTIVKSCVAFRLSAKNKVTQVRCDIQPRGEYERLSLYFFRLNTGPEKSDANEDILQHLRRIGDKGYFAERQADYPRPLPDDFPPESLRLGYDLFVAMPVSNLVTIPIDGHKLLTRLSPEWDQKYKLRFKDAFPELASVDGPFENADLLSATLTLKAEADRTGDAFEAAGLKIPAEAAVWCGILLIFGVQLYMLIHLREFGNRVDREAGFEVAWIGVYVSHLARVILFVSLLVLPACTIVLLSRRLFRMIETRWLGWVIFVASICASMTLSFLIFRALPEPRSSSIASPPPED